MTRFLFALLLLVAIGAVGILRAQTPRTISFQGILSDAAGRPVADGTHFAVRVYDQALGGTPLFEEAVNVAVEGGVFSLGKGFFDGGTQNGGADIAEAFDVAGERSSYTPGDVLVISTERTRQVTRAREPYSTLVAGVYATKPGVLLTEAMNDESIEEKVPMGVLGEFPTKVTGENGPIAIGDLVVSSSTPGHAMKADITIARDRPGCIIGKALEGFDGGGVGGVILVLVNVR